MRLSWLALFAERAWEGLLWPFVVVAAFLVFTLLGGWSLMPPLAHRILLGAFGLALIVSFLPLVRMALADPGRSAAASRAQRQHQAPARLVLRGQARHHAARRDGAALGAAPPAPRAPRRQAETLLAGAAHRPRRPLCDPRRAVARAHRRLRSPPAAMPARGSLRPSRPPPPRRRRSSGSMPG